MPHYTVIGFNRKTGERKKHSFWANDAEDARDIASQKGTVTESVIEETTRFASQSQKDYATALGISFPDDITMEDMSVLIADKLDPMLPGERAKAEKKAAARREKQRRESDWTTRP